MRTDEELIAEHNMQIIASALFYTIKAICKIEGCDQLKDIADNGNSI